MYITLRETLFIPTLWTVMVCYDTLRWLYEMRWKSCPARLWPVSTFRVSPHHFTDLNWGTRVHKHCFRWLPPIHEISEKQGLPSWLVLIEHHVQFRIKIIGFLVQYFKVHSQRWPVHTKQPTIQYSTVAEHCAKAMVLFNYLNDSYTGALKPWLYNTAGCDFWCNIL